ncbi:MAG: Mu transposase C-terminal domain-containing protein [Pyrinomonadaceae bacterium]
MPRGRLSRGAHIFLLGREYVIEKRLIDRSIQIKDVALNEYLTVKEDELIDRLFDGSMEFVTVREHSSHVNRKSLEFVVEELSLLDDADPKQRKKKEKLKKETKRKYRYVSEVLSQKVVKRTHDSLRPIIDKVKKEVKDPSPPSWLTLRLWVIAFMNSGEDICVLVPRESKKGNKKPKFGYRRGAVITGNGKRKFTADDEERAKLVEEIIRQAINDVYLNDERHSKQEVADEAEARVRADNRHRRADDQLPIPDPSNVYRAIDRWDPYEVDVARYGQKYADLKYKAVGTGPRPKRPLELVQIDSTTLDLFVVDPETGTPIGRPTLFVAIDVCTKMILGCYLSFNDTSYVAVMHCLLHAIKPKDYVKARYPNIKHEWNCHGLMEVLKVDNAMAFHGESLEDAALQLGFLIDYAPAGTPWFKASIERLIRTKNAQLTHQLPGTTFSNIFQKKGYDPLKHALISKSTLEEIIHVYIIDIYSRQVHRGIRDVPARRWDELVAKYPPTYPRKSSDLNVLLGQVVWRTVQRTGIEIDGLYYRSEELASLRSRIIGKQRTTEKKVKIKVNPEDLSLIHVQDEFKGKYIAVPAEDQEYTKGLTQFQHDVFRNFARERVMDYVKREDLISAREYIKQLVKDEWESSKRKLRGVTVARFLNHGRDADAAPDVNGDSCVEESQVNEAEAPKGPARLYPEAATGRGASNIGSAFEPTDEDQSSEASPNSELPATVPEDTLRTTENDTPNVKRRTRRSGKASAPNTSESDVDDSSGDAERQATGEDDYKVLGGWTVEYD